MEIFSYFENQAFDADTVKVLVAAFEHSRDQLDPSDLSNPLMVKLVAKLIGDFAKQGERDPDRLNGLVSEALRE